MEIECFMVLKKRREKKILKGSREECERDDDRGRVRSTVDKLPFSFQSVGKNKACSLGAIYFSSSVCGNSIHQFGYNGYFSRGPRHRRYGKRKWGKAITLFVYLR